MPYLQDQIRDINAFHLDQKVIFVWALGSLIPSIILLIFGVVISFALEGSILGISSTELPFWTFVILFLINAVYVLWLYLEYKSYIYYFTTSSVVIKHGVINTERHVVPYENIQDIRISRAIIERFLNLATVQIETAAHGSYIAKYLIPSVSNYRSIVNHIMEKTKQLAEKTEKRKRSGNDEIISLLGALLEEVKELKNVMSKKNSSSKSNKGR